MELGTLAARRVSDLSRVPRSDLSRVPRSLFPRSFRSARFPACAWPNRNTDAPQTFEHGLRVEAESQPDRLGRRAVEVAFGGFKNLLLVHPVDGLEAALLNVLRSCLSTDAELDRHVLHAAGFLESSHQSVDLILT